MKSTRRTFLAGATGAAAARRARAATARITGIALSTIQGNFHKFVAANSYDNEPKGTTYTNTLVRISTDLGIEGVGVMGYTKPDRTFLEDLRSLVGADPESVYDFRDGRIAGRAAPFNDLLVKYKHLDGPLCDLIGKVRGVPCWRLFGESVRSGYQGIKLKIGRGSKWMDREEGLQRDIEVIRAVRTAIGMEPKLLVDANNGYRDDFEGACCFSVCFSGFYQIIP